MFENEHFLIVEKRCGYLSVPSRLRDAETRPCELQFWKKEKGMRLWAIHRLDEEVSGVLMFAKNSDSHRIANNWFEKKQIQKTYEALTEPAGLKFPVSSVQVWKSRLLRGKKRAYEREFGKESLTQATHLKEVQFHEKFSLWELHPITGRSHQLRFELAKHGFPVLGDELYGSKSKLKIPNAIALRAVKLELRGCPEREKLGLPEILEVSHLSDWVRENQAL